MQDNQNVEKITRTKLKPQHQEAPQRQEKRKKWERTDKRAAYD